MPFPDIVIEAEAGSPTAILTGSARVVSDADASGGLLVTGLGLSSSEQPPGALEII